MCCSGPTSARNAPSAYALTERASGGNKFTSVADRIETQGEASGLPSTIRIASGGGLERRKLRLSTRVTPLISRSFGATSAEMVKSEV